METPEHAPHGDEVHGDKIVEQPATPTEPTEPTEPAPSEPTEPAGSPGE